MSYMVSVGHVQTLLTGAKSEERRTMLPDGLLLAISGWVGWECK